MFRNHRREWFFVWAWAVLVAGLLVIPYARRFADEWHEWRFSGIVSADFRDTAYHLGWVRQARDGEWLFESKYAGADSRGKGFFNLLFLTMGALARWTGLSVVNLFHVTRTLVAVLVLVAAYWFAAQFFRDRRMRWAALVLVTTSAGFESLDAVGYWPPGVENLEVPQTVTAWSLEWQVVVGPAMGTVLVSLVTMRRAALKGGSRPLAAVVGLGLAQAAVYPHDLMTVGVAAAGFVAVTAATARPRGPALKRGLAALGAFVLGAAPVVAYHLAVLIRDPSYWDYARIQDPFRTASWPLYYGVILMAAVAGAAAVVRRRERGRTLLVVWPAVMALLLATPYPRMQRVHLYHGLHVALCLLATRGLWAAGGWLARRGVRRRLAPLGLAAFAALASLVYVAHFAGELTTWEARHFTFLRAGEMEGVAYLDAHTGTEEVIACLPAWGVGLPMWTGSRVYVGHLEITLDYPKRADQMERLMGRDGPPGPSETAILLRQARADYVFVENSARRLGASAMERTVIGAALAERVFANHWTAVYRVRGRS